MFKNLISVFQRMIPSASNVEAESWPSEFTIIDVRSAGEFSGDHVEGAINIEHDRIGKGIAKVCAGKHRRIYLYCRSGGRASMARSELIKLGYTDTYNAGNLRGMKKILERTKAQAMKPVPGQ
jgi:phage shock protein E